MSAMQDEANIAELEEEEEEVGGGEQRQQGQEGELPPPPPMNTSSFKPVSSGHQRVNKEHKKKPKSPKKGVQVAQLDERNLKKAVHRYGTLPKGDRIGAYLESLKQSGMTPEIPQDFVDSDTLSSQRSDSHSGGDTLDRVKQQQQQMMRSNSSHGGFNSGQNSKQNTPSDNPPLRRALTSMPTTSPKTKRKIINNHHPHHHHQHHLPERLPPPPPPVRTTTAVGHRESPDSDLESPAVGSLASPGSTLDMIR